jgi:hypothetical protein
VGGSELAGGAVGPLGQCGAGLGVVAQSVRWDNVGAGLGGWRRRSAGTAWALVLALLRTRNALTRSRASGQIHNNGPIWPGGHGLHQDYSTIMGVAILNRIHCRFRIESDLRMIWTSRPISGPLLVPFLPSKPSCHPEVEVTSLPYRCAASHADSLPGGASPRPTAVVGRLPGAGEPLEGASTTAESLKPSPQCRAPCSGSPRHP